MSNLKQQIIYITCKLSSKVFLNGATALSAPRNFISGNDETSAGFIETKTEAFSPVKSLKIKSVIFFYLVCLKYHFCSLTSHP